MFNPGGPEATKLTGGWWRTASTRKNAFIGNPCFHGSHWTSIGTHHPKKKGTSDVEFVKGARVCGEALWCCIAASSKCLTNRKPAAPTSRLFEGSALGWGNWTIQGQHVLIKLEILGIKSIDRTGMHLDLSLKLSISSISHREPYNLASARAVVTPVSPLRTNRQATPPL